MVCRSSDLKGLSYSAVTFINAENKSFFCSLAWYENFLDTVLVKDSTWSSTFIEYEQDKAVQTLLPLKFSTSKSGSRNFESLTNYYSPIFHLTVKPELYSLQAFFKVFSATQKNWDMMTLRALPEHEVSSMSSDLTIIGLPNLPFFCFANWYLEVKQRSFDEYFSDLSSRVRNTVTRKTKQFNRLDNARVEIVIGKEGVEKGIQAFESVYASSWKEEEAYPEFISGLIKLASEQGALRLGIAYLNDIAVAAQLWIVADNSAYIYKLAYDEKYKKLSIGSILTVTLMRHVIDIDKVDYVDYLSGDDTYKKEWMSHRRERWGLMVFNRQTWRGCLQMANEFSRFYFKNYFLKANKK